MVGKAERRMGKAFLNNGSYRSVFELADDETFWNTPCEVSYPIAGAFTAYLVDRLGAADYLEQIYKPKASLAGKVNQTFQQTPEAVEKDFIAWVEAT